MISAKKRFLLRNVIGTFVVASVFMFPVKAQCFQNVPVWNAMKKTEAAELMEGGSFQCKTGSVSWKLTADGSLIIYGDGVIHNFTINIDKTKVKKIYCESVVRCDDTYLENIFSNMPNLEYVNLAPISMEYKLDCSDGMFKNCPKLKEVNLSSFRLIGNLNNLFEGCQSLEKVILPVDGYIAELPVQEGYQWIKNKSAVEYGNLDEVKVLLCNGETITKEPINYAISYRYTLMKEANGSGGYIWDKEKQEFVESGEGQYSGYTYNNWENNSNPTSYNIEDNIVNIEAPRFIPDGYKLAYYTPATIDPKSMQYVQVDAVFVPDDFYLDREPAVDDIIEKPVITEYPTTEQLIVEKPVTTEKLTMANSTQVSTEKIISDEQKTDIQHITNDAKVAAEKKVKILKIKNIRQQKLQIKFKKIKGYKYQIKLCTSKKFKKNVKTYDTSKTTYIVKNLKKGKTYYVKARTCKQIDNRTVYGRWSVVKMVKIK